jgi:hypothetical protein
MTSYIEIGYLIFMVTRRKYVENKYPNRRKKREESELTR